MRQIADLHIHSKYSRACSKELTLENIAVSTAVGTGLGFGLIIFAFSSIREKLEASNVPEAWKGVPISLVVAGIMSLAFLGLAGII